MLTHYFEGLGDRVLVTHLDETFRFEVSREEVRPGAPLSVRFEMPPSFEAVQDGPAWWIVVHRARGHEHFMRFGAEYPNRLGKESIVCIAFDASRDWRVDWSEHTVKVPPPRRHSESIAERWARLKRAKAGA